MGDTQAQSRGTLRKGHGESVEKHGAVVRATGARRVMATCIQQVWAVHMKAVIHYIQQISEAYMYGQQRQLHWRLLKKYCRRGDTAIAL